MKRNKQGFTLIELLVVVAIIGLLSTLSILSLNTARARARDAKRVADVKQIQTALEMYYNEAGQYPAAVATGTPITYNGSVFLRAVPTPPTIVDGNLCPTPVTAYTYSATNTAGSGGTYSIAYCLGAKVNDLPFNQVLYATPAGIR